ncbi:DNA polymerase III subunit delta' [Aneurinibacillus migulanus]|uniref:GlcG/HbpS family heme-binding protein n=1 Tax=Aneurinibacillus migulanus TaxID=47500 RepID=UPI0005B9F649|nr:heme-binding protein [Aneurinibacillus migulanus]KIV50997.1 DNA polymerase III subunit delta' [Aneurinibacillus migulanus]KPD07001.1 DNA polymerase III subunit delta' [Aneurinibacillus migulanus]MCP1355129.1 heme-binding protein [Aneurinibacillus migulanus]
MSRLTLDIAKAMIEHAEHEAHQIGVPMVISVVDEGGNLVAFHRMDDALLVSIDIAQNKAWTSVALKMPTANLAEASAPGAELYGINTTNNGRVILFGGGIPLCSENRIIGAVGVSGGSVEQDVRVAEAAVKSFETMMVDAGA